jgi:hypothetical protein
VGLTVRRMFSLVVLAATCHSPLMVSYSNLPRGLRVSYLSFFHRYFSQCPRAGSSKFYSTSECYTCAVDGITGTSPPNVPPSSYFTQLPYCDFSGLSMDQEHTLVISSISDFNLDSILYTIPKNPSRRATPPLSPAHFLIDDTRIDRIKYDSGWQPETIPAHFDFNKTLTVSFGKNIASSFNFQGMYTIYNVIFGVLGLVRHIPFPL